MERDSNFSVIVGIGSSAGGLEALRALLSRLPVDRDFTYVIAQHLAPQHTSMLTSLLSRDTLLPVVQLEGNIKPLGGVVYVTPPNHNIVFRDGYLILEDPFEKGPKPSIDELFISLSEAAEVKAAGILLSGSGSDGTLGARRLREAGGVVLAQEPRLAKYPSMPQSAISAGSVDYVLPAEEIGPKLAEISWHNTQESTLPIAKGKSSEIDRILEKLSLATQIDFRGYKQNTLNRRIHQRLVATHTKSLEEYINLLDSNRDEAQRLAQSCLVSVTSFFRENSYFELLCEELRARLVPAPGQAIRVWVPGCATGEEAFSLSILLGQIYPAQRIQIFGTDIDEAAISTARRAWYSREAVESLNPELVRTSFIESGAGYSVERSIRDRVVFARHDLLRDPLFLNLDLISCRNLLIYLKPALQEEVMRKFHHALKENGLLFLGRSEHAVSDYFDQVDRRARIYRNKAIRPSERRLPVTRDWNGWDRARKDSVPTPSTSASVNDALLRYFAPAAVLTDTGGQIVELIGNLSQILRFPTGKPHFSLLQLVPRVMAPSLRAQMQRAAKSGAVAKSVPRRFESDGKTLLVEATVIPHPLPNGDQGLLVLFQIGPAPERAPNTALVANDELVVELERELAATREGLQAAVEQLENSNDELQSLNEELHAANEELQAAIEELQSSNEELQSTNEELITVNEELEHKTIELGFSIEDLENIQDTLNGALIVVDSKGTIRSLNNEARNLFQLSSNDIGSPLHFPGHPAVSVQLAPKLQEVLAGGERVDFQMELAQSSFRVLIRPYVSHKKIARGALVVFEEISSYIATEKRLREHEILVAELRRFNEQILNSHSAAVAVLDSRGSIQSVNESWLAMAGNATGEDFLNFITARLTLSTNEKLELHQKLGSVLSGTVRRSSTQFMTRHNGALQSYRISMSAIGPESTLSVLLAIEDLSASAELTRQLQLQEAALQSSVGGMAITNLEGRIEWANRAMENLTGHSVEALLKQTPAIFETPHTREPFAQALDQCRLAGQSLKTEIELRKSSGELRMVRRTITPILSSDASVTNFVTTLEDITDAKIAEQRLQFLVQHDQLTSLWNRQTFVQELQEAISRQRKRGGRIAVLFLDLDRFKDTNDTLGHLAGDQILIEVGRRLRSSLGGPDTLARFGGDEFVYFLEDFQSPEQLEAAVSRFLATINRPIEFASRTIFLSGSLGIAVFPQDGQNAEELLRNADLAMYRAKFHGRRGFRYFDQILATEISQRVSVEHDLARAIGANDLWVAFQPQVDLRTNSISGVESLLRWQGSSVHQIPIGRVIAIAEETGLILSIGEWVIRQSLEQLAKWQSRRFPLKLSINLSAMQFNQQDVFGIVMQALSELAIPASAVKMEITESVLLNRSSRVKECLHAFHGAGIGLILDDFGTGYSSLTYLREYPIESVKIDASFLRGIGLHAHDEAIVRGIIQLAHSLGQNVIAEGVETQQQLDFLRAADCDFAQGFLFSHALAAKDFEAQFSSPQILQ